MTPQLIQIVGAGQMGRGIAEVSLTAGYRVCLVDTSHDQLSYATERLNRKLSGELFSLLTTRTELLSQHTSMIIEAIAENLALKKHFWSGWNSWRSTNYPNTPILASNTSSYSITELASFTEEPQSFVGIHFMNPVPQISLVEVIRGQKTSKKTYKKAIAFVQSLSKIPITVADRPGFVVNRILLPMINEAAFLLEDSVASAEDIDKAMTLGARHPLGPLALADLIGLDTCLAILEDLHHRMGNDKYRPCPLFYHHVTEGYLGRKSGQGFYTYENQS